MLPFLRPHRTTSRIGASYRIVFLSVLLGVLWSARPAVAITPGPAFGIGAGNFDGAEATTVDGAGNVYVVGSFRGTVDFAPGSAVFNLTSTTDVVYNQITSDAFVAKYARDGALVWARAFGGTSSDAAHGVSVDGCGSWPTFVGAGTGAPGT